MGLIKNEIFYTYRDITILPNPISHIEHRKECIPLDENGMLPLFTAPMDTVVNENNFEKFTEEMVYAILPRTVDLSKRIEFSLKRRWAAYSLKEFEGIFCNEKEKLDESKGICALIDVANGHMKKIFDLVRASRNIYGDNIIIMVGNIANPQTYEEYANIGVDYIRCGIGSGNGCLSTSNTGIHMPMASLIDKIAEIKKFLSSMKIKKCGDGSCGYKPKYTRLPKIVADGGIRNYSDIIKALALGADYVMVGSVFARMLESAAVKYCDSENWLSLPSNVIFEDIKDVYKAEDGWYGKYNGNNIFLGNIKATFYGMASKEGQIALNGQKVKTSEGIKKTLSVDYTMHTWCENFADYLRSAMSYVGVNTLDEFRENTVTIVNSSNAIEVVNK